MCDHLQSSLLDGRRHDDDVILLVTRLERTPDAPEVERRRAWRHVRKSRVKMMGQRTTARAVVVPGSTEVER
jgi:hypothetical protein